LFLVSRGKTQISPLLAPSGKNLGKFSLFTPGKNPSDARDHHPVFSKSA